MMERVIKSSLRAGEIVLEPFGGSGSTLIAAERAGRVCFTMELLPEWCDVIVRRWQKVTGQQAVRESDAVAFDEAARGEGERLAA
jgi:DNA modification methylase